HFADASSPNSLFFFFTPPATTKIYTLSLHDALPISERSSARRSVKTSHRKQPSHHTAEWRGLQSTAVAADLERCRVARKGGPARDRKSTRLNSSHVKISYAVFCLKKKKKATRTTWTL